ncbi:MAG: polysaccharide biosynthesis protein [Bacteroidales bacterium]|nr:polysaccharide biosynthesis protein [Bacteroidales bacterium]
MENPFKRFTFHLVKKYRHSTVSQWIIFIIDVLLFVVAFAITEAFRYVSNGSVEVIVRTEVVKFIVALMLTLIFFLATGSFRGIIRHAGMSDIWKILVATIVPGIIFVGVNLFNNQFSPQIIPSRYLLSYRETFLLYLLLAVLMIVERLMLQRIYNDYFRRRRPEQNVVIYGAGAAGIIAYNALLQDFRTEYHVVAFVDDDMSKVNQKLNDVPVMRVRNVLNPKFVEKNKVMQLIIAIPTIRMSHKQAITTRALDLGLTVKAVPHISTWMNGSFSSNQIEEIKIEDLLGREPIKMDNVNIVREVVDKVVLVTGAAGSIGSEICRQLMRYQPAKVVMLDQAESPMYDLQFELKNTFADRLDQMEFVIANVKDKARMEEVFEAFHPQLVYHAAAYKHVPFMEENPYEAVYINVFGTRNLADLAIKYGVQKFVMISTDKAVNPTNVMGATKRMAEIYIQSRSTDKTHFVTTRFGNVLGSNGSVIPLFKKQLAAGGPLTVTHKDIIRFFMTIPEACNLVLEAGAMGEGGDIFVFDMGKPVKIYDMARKMIQLSGRHNIEIKEIGLRPGEKLYEELLATKENTIPTYHPKIMHAQVRRYDINDVDREYNELWQVLETMDDMKIVAKMKHIVPEFLSNNSIYCQLDTNTPPSTTSESMRYVEG